MADPLVISSPANRRVVAARKLRLRKYRRGEQRFMLEGLQALHMALDAKSQPLEVFYAPEQLDTPGARALLARLRQTDCALLPVSPAVMAALSERDEPQGMLGVFALPPHDLATLERTPLLRSEARGPALILVLDRLQDPGNAGTLIRTADAVGAAAVILLEPCVDPYDPKVLRSSMGSLFNLPVVTARDAESLFAWLETHALRVIAADAHAGEWCGDTVWQGDVALVLGNEARGLSEEVAPRIRHHVRLPLRGKADSLNVAVAGGVLMYRWLHENSQN